MKAEALLVAALLAVLGSAWFFEEVKAQGLLEEAKFCTPGSTRPCPDMGICKGRVKVCQDGRWAEECTGGVEPAPQETCDNGLDDNCNGAVDECVSLSGSFGIFLIIGGIVLLLFAIALSRVYK